MKSNSAKWEVLLLVCLATISELLGRHLFPNGDMRFILYGSHTWTQYNVIWMWESPGLNYLFGILADWTKNPELNITITGILLNIFATLTTWKVGKNLRIPNIAIISASICTGLWFKPMVGGWLGDHIAFLVGIFPALLIYLLNGRMPGWSFLALGACAALGLTLKLNNTGPGLLISSIWIILLWARLHKTKNYRGVRNFFSGVAIALMGLMLTALLLQSLIPIDKGLYQWIFNFYGEVLNSDASSQLGSSKLWQFPLQLDLLKAFQKRELGVLIFLPLLIGYWLALIESARNICSRNTEKFLRYSFALFLLLSSAFIGYGLARGVTHRVFLIPAGIIFALPQKINFASQKQISIFIAFFSALSFTLFAVVQYPLGEADASKGYNERLLTKSNLQKYFCIGDEIQPDIKDKDKATIIIRAKPTTTNASTKNARCFTELEFNKKFAGVADDGELWSLANVYNAPFLNTLRPGGGELKAKWAGSQTTEEGRRKWVKENAKYIKDGKFQYVLEAIPGAGVGRFVDRRKQQQREFIEEISGTKVGEFAGMNIWRTPLAQGDD